MAAVLKIRQIGNSAGVILPREELERLRLGIGDELSIRKSENGLELSPYDENFSKRVEALENSHRKFRNAYKELAK